MAEIYVAVGSNIAPEKNVPKAIQQLREVATVIAASTFYQTRPLTRPQQADYRNGVVLLRTPLERGAVERDLLKPIESALGRVREADKHAARTIDLDLTVYCEDDRVIWMDPEAFQRNFIIVPLAELNATLELPDGQTANELAGALGHEGLVPDEALTRRLKELLNDE